MFRFESNYSSGVSRPGKRVSVGILVCVYTCVSVCVCVCVYALDILHSNIIYIPNRIHNASIWSSNADSYLACRRCVVCIVVVAFVILLFVQAIGIVEEKNYWIFI